MLFHQGSYRSATGVENSPRAVFTVRVSPPTFPTMAAGTPMIWGLLDHPGGVVGGDGDHHAVLRFTEKKCIEPDGFAAQRGEVHGRAAELERFPGHLLAEARFRERHGKATVAAIMGALHHAFADQAEQGRVRGPSPPQRSTRGGRPVFCPCTAFRWSHRRVPAGSAVSTEHQQQDGIPVVP